MKIFITGGHMAERLPERAGDVRHSRADVSALHAAGFRPVSSLDAGLAGILSCFRHHQSSTA